MFQLHMTLMVVLLAFLASCHSQNHSEYRLPDTHIPKSYVLRLTIDPNASGFNGEVKISFSTKSDTNFIHLHAYKSITIKEVTLNAEHTCNVTSIDTQTDIVHIECQKPVPKSEYNEILIKFDAAYSITSNGLYRNSYEYQDKTELFVTSQFEPTDARKAFPCFDEPNFKAEFDIMIVHPKNYSAVSNTPVSARTIEEPYMFTKFEKTPPMSTYLLAFIVSKYDSKSSSPSVKNPDAFPITVRFIPGQENRTQTALRYGGNLIYAHSIFTGAPYDTLGNPKMDFIGVPLFGGAMENWGAIIFDEYALFDEGNATLPEHEQYIINVMAHELAHQWFGDYVTLNWWSDVWLNEGFADFFEMHFDEHVTGTEMELQRQFVPANLHSALQTDEVIQEPLSNKDNEVYTSHQIQSKFDGISYDKGASIIRMMRSILGKENFQKGIQQYIKEYGHKNANSKQLLDALGLFYNNSEHSFEELLHNWVYVRGYPLVSVSLNADGKSVQIKQEVYTEKSKWYIPISYTTSKEKNFDVRVDKWLFDTPLTVPLEGNSWFIVNLQQTGFFRVKYDTALWKRIIDGLKSPEMDKIHVSSRTQLLDDAFSFAGTNITLSLLEYLKHETEYEPWFVVNKKIRTLIAAMKKNGELEAAQALRNHTLSWINEAFPDDKEKNRTTHLQKLTHNVIVQLKGSLQDETTLSDAVVIYKNYISDKHIEDFNKRKMALCQGFKLSVTPKADFDILLRYYQETDSAYERIEILSSLGCSNDPQILNMYLSEAISKNSRISTSHIKNVFEAVYNNYESGLDVFLSFLLENIEKINEEYGKILKLNDIIWKSAMKVFAQEQLSKVEKLIMEHQNLGNLMKVGTNKFKSLSKYVAKKIQTIDDITENLICL